MSEGIVAIWNSRLAFVLSVAAVAGLFSGAAWTVVQYHIERFDTRTRIEALESLADRAQKTHESMAIHAQKLSELVAVEMERNQQSRILLDRVLDKVWGSTDALGPTTPQSFGMIRDEMKDVQPPPHPPVRSGG